MRKGFQIWASVRQHDGTYCDEEIGTATHKGTAYHFAKTVAAMYPQVAVRHKNRGGLDVVDFTLNRPD